MTNEYPSLFILHHDLETAKTLAHPLVKEFSVFMGNSGQRVEEFLRDNPVKVVYSTQKLLDTTGIRFFSKLNREHPAIKKVLIAPEGENPEYLQRAKVLGIIDEYLQEPLTSSAIGELTGKFLEAECVVRQQKEQEELAPVPPTEPTPSESSELSDLELDLRDFELSELNDFAELDLPEGLDLQYRPDLAPPPIAPEATAPKAAAQIIGTDMDPSSYPRPGVNPPKLDTSARNLQPPGETAGEAAFLHALAQQENTQQPPPLQTPVQPFSPQPALSKQAQAQQTPDFAAMEGRDNKIKQLEELVQQLQRENGRLRSHMEAARTVDSAKDASYARYPTTRQPEALSTERVRKMEQEVADLRQQVRQVQDQLLTVYKRMDQMVSRVSEAELGVCIKLKFVSLQRVDTVAPTIRVWQDSGIWCATIQKEGERAPSQIVKST